MNKVKKPDNKKVIIERFLHEAALMKTPPEDIATMRQMLEKISLEELITKYMPEWESSLYKHRPVPVREWIESPDHMNLKGQVYPLLLDDIEEMFEGGYNEIILSGCIDHSALIMEADGGLPTLGERIGTERDVITIMDGEGLSTSMTVNTRDSGVKQVRKITLRNGYELKLTPDHRVRVYRDGYQWVPAEDLVEGDYVITPRKVVTTPSANTSLNEAKFLAYWITNGSLKKNHTMARYASANTATVRELVDVLSEMGFDSKSYQRKGTAAWEVYVKRVKTSGFLDKLLNSDVVHSAHDAVVPDAITRASNEVVAVYLNRVWAAEGTCYYGGHKSPPRFMLAMASERFIKQVQLLLLRFGVQSRTRLSRQYDKRRGSTTHVYELSVSGIRDMQLFLDNIGPILGKEERCERIAEYCAERKANTNVDLLPITLGRLSKMISDSDIVRPAGDPWWGISTRPTNRVSRGIQADFIRDFPGHYISEWLENEFPEDVAYTPVVSNVELDEPIPTGDIGALQGNRFVANGVGVHNSIGWGKCKSRNTVLDVIIDNNQWSRMSIEDVVNLPTGTNIKVLSSNDDYTLEAHQVVGRVMSGVKPVYRVKLKSGKYTDATAEHPILTNEGYKRVDELQAGQLIATARILPTNEGNSLDPDLVTFLAYMIADGGTTHRVTFTKSDPYVLTELERVLTSLGGRVGARRTAGKNKITQTMSLLGVDDLIVEYGFAGVKSVDKRVPAAIINADRASIGLFLAKFIECDGHLRNESRTIEIGLGNKGLVDDLTTLFLKLGIHTRVKTKTIKMQHSGEPYDVWILVFSGEDVVTFLKEFPVSGEKAARAQEIIDTVVTRPSSNFDVVPIDYEGSKRLRAYYAPVSKEDWDKYLNMPKGQWLSRQKLGMIKEHFGHLPEWADQYLNSDIYWDRVESVTYQGEEPVYDIEVPTTSNFVANGIVVHNSFIVSLILTRVLYELSCYKNPQHALGLADGSPIVIPNVALKLSTAQDVVFKYMQNFIRSSPYFREEFPLDKDLTKSLQFPHGITVQPVATTNASVIGLNVFASCFPAEQEFLKSDGTLGRMIDYVDKYVTVPTLDEGGKVRDVTTRVVRTGVKPLVRLTLSNGDYIECTEDQRFQDTQGRWVRAADTQGRSIKLNGGGTYLEDWAAIECVSVEPIPDSVQDVYDLEDTGRTHIFFAKVGSGFVQAKNCLDEVNFFERIVNSKRGDGVNEVFDQAENMYRLLHNRITSRFLLPDGTYPGKLLMVSSARYPDDFTTRKYEEAKAAGKKIFYRRYSQWEPKYGKDGYPGKTFKVSIGNSAIRPRIIRSPRHPNYEPLLDDIKELEHEGVKIIDVPEEHRTAFEIDVDAAVRDIAGYPTLSRHPFFRDMEPWYRSFERAEERGIRHPWTKLMHVTLDDGSTWIRDYLDESKRLFPHFVHIDLALTQDAAGIAVVRLDGVEEIEHPTLVTDPETGEATETTTREYAPILTAVLVQQIMPVKGREIPISKVRRIVLDLVNWGYNIKKVTFDQYNSADSIQQFRQLNIDSDRISMDRTTEPSTTLKEILEQDRLDIYDHPVLKDEAAAVELDVKRGKVDHPPGGCLTGDTMVMTSKGMIPIAELADEGRDNRFWVHGALEDGSILVSEAYNAHLTGKNMPVVTVWLDNDRQITATPDHKFMLRDGSYLPAEELAVGTSLMSPTGEVKVVAVTPSGTADVYDITVPATSNFLTGAGIVVHNSKDVLDALTGAVYSAVTYVSINGGQLSRGEFMEESTDKPVLLSFGSATDEGYKDMHDWLYS